MLQPSHVFPGLPDADSRPAGEHCEPASAPSVYLVCDDDSGGWRWVACAGPGALPVCAPASPSCMVVKALLPGSDGPELVARLAAAHADIPIIFIMGVSDVSMTVRVMKAGASEVLIKPFDSEVLRTAIAQALQRSRSSFDYNVEVRSLRGRYATLSRREREVMALVVLGRLNKQIAAELGISEITVKAHRGRMMRKMRTRSLAQLVIMHARIGLRSAQILTDPLGVSAVRDRDLQRAGAHLPHRLGVPHLAAHHRRGAAWFVTKCNATARPRSGRAVLGVNRT
jgi:FixJ family two-component response regulator